MKNSFKSKNTSFYFIMSMKYMYLYVRNLQVHLYNKWIKRHEVRSIALMKQPRNQRKTHHLKAFVTQF